MAESRGVPIIMSRDHVTCTRDRVMSARGVDMPLLSTDLSLIS